jgi:hypothetical protein
MEEAAKELILYATGNYALAPLKKQYIWFRDTTVLSILDHLRQKTVIQMTPAQKHEYKTSRYKALWDPTSSITAYLTHLNRFQLTGWSRHHNKQGREDNGGWRPNVAKQDVHQRPDGCMGEHDGHQPDMDKPPSLLHPKMARNKGSGPKNVILFKWSQNHFWVV